jgi:NACalpha-BTF3-like transcription factor
MEQASCSRDSAIGALRACDGSPAEAILSLIS